MKFLAQLSSLLLILFLCSATISAQWVQQGPAPSINGQSEGLAENQITGAVNCVTPHPSLARILYIGATNGGVWRSTNVTSSNPNWTFISGDLPNQSIGALEFDPTDATGRTLVIANGRTSSLGGIGGVDNDIYRTTTGTEPWTDIDPDDELGDRNITGLVARGAIIVVSTPNGIYRTTDTGDNWTRISNLPGSGLPTGFAFDLVGDPSNSNRLYTNAGTNGIYRSDDTGETWEKVSDATVDTGLSGTVNVRLAAGNSNNLYVATARVISPRIERLVGLFRYDNSDESWASLDLPTTNEACGTFGIHPGGQGNRHFSLVADPNDANVVYIGGDRQPANSETCPTTPPVSQFPNVVGANGFSGRLFRVDASLASGNQFSSITHSGTASGTAPHADSRDMDFDANGDLLEGDDGGIYKQSSPADATGDWSSLIGNANLSEVHSMDWDANANILIVGLQDNGTSQQQTSTNNVWSNVAGGDGGDVAIDDISSNSQSTRYNSAQFFLGFTRRTYSTGNVLQASTTVRPALINTATGATIRGVVNFNFVTPIKLNSQNANRLLILTRNGLFESGDQGATVTRVINTTLGTPAGFDLLAYGASDNADIIYAGFGNNLRSRTTATGNLNTLGSYAGGAIQGLTIDPSDSQSAYVVDPLAVYETTDGGTSFEDITGNLQDFEPQNINAVAYIPNSTNDMLAVGTDRGVFIAPGPDFDTWTRLGETLPNAPVFDLEYDAADQILAAGLLGRGAWTFNLAERDPVDVALVMDFSGSMLNKACGSCDPKINVLKDAAEIFVQLWKGLAVGDDRLGSVYFRTQVDQFIKDGDFLQPVLTNSDDIISNIREQSTDSDQFTAMGGGLQMAVNELTATDRPQNIILFTDGIQNVDPGLRYPGMQIEDGQYSRNSNVNPTVPPTVLNTGLGIKVNTIGIGASPAFATQLSDLSDATEGLTKITTAPDEDLIQFYVEELVDVLRDFSPQLVAYRKGTYRGSVTERVQINPSSKRILFKVSYDRRKQPKVQIYKQKKEVTQFAEVIQGEFYQILTFPFEVLQGLQQDLPGTDWVVALTHDNQPSSYQVGVISDEELLDYRFWTRKATIAAGDPIELGSEIIIKGKKILENVSVTATVCAPSQNIGNILATQKPSGINKLDFEKGTPIGEMKLAALLLDAKFRKGMEPIKKEVQLTPDSQKQFSTKFNDTKIPGVYTIIFRIKGDDPATGPYERMETRSVVVRNAKIDLGASDIRSGRFDGRIWNFSIKPTDIHGFLLGPDYGPLLDIKVTNGNLKEIQDVGNGSYQIRINSRSNNAPSLRIGIGEEVWFNGKLDN